MFLEKAQRRTVCQVIELSHRADQGPEVPPSLPEGERSLRAVPQAELLPLSPDLPDQLRSLPTRLTTDVLSKFKCRWLCFTLICFICILHVYVVFLQCLLPT